MSATAAEYAAIDFEPIDVSGLEGPPSGAEWSKLADPYLLTMRVAWRLIQHSKPGAIEFARWLNESERCGVEMIDDQRPAHAAPR